MSHVTKESLVTGLFSFLVTRREYGSAMVSVKFEDWKGGLSGRCGRVGVASS